MTICPECGSEIKSQADGCSSCKKNNVLQHEKRRAQADILMKIGAIIFIFGLLFPIFFITGGVLFGAGAVIWLMNRQ